MVRLGVHLLPPPRDRQSLKTALRSLMLETRIERGCLGCNLWCDPNSTVHYFEEWATEADARRRIQSDRFRSLLVLIDTAREPPRIELDFGTRQLGLDSLLALRGGGSIQ